MIPFAFMSWVGQVAIPVVPTVRVVITFTKFVELQPIEQFYTPLSSPRHFGPGSSDDDSQSSSSSSSPSTSSSSTWLRQNNSQSASKHHQQQLEADPFAIPREYTWTSVDDNKSSKMRKSKSTRRSK